MRVKMKRLLPILALMAFVLNLFLVQTLRAELTQSDHWQLAKIAFEQKKVIITPNELHEFISSLPTNGTLNTAQLEESFVRFLVNHAKPNTDNSIKVDSAKSPLQEAIRIALSNFSALETFATLDTSTGPRAPRITNTELTEVLSQALSSETRPLIQNAIRHLISFTTATLDATMRHEFQALLAQTREQGLPFDIKTNEPIFGLAVLFTYQARYGPTIPATHKGILGSAETTLGQKYIKIYVFENGSYTRELLLTLGELTQISLTSPQNIYCESALAPLPTGSLSPCAQGSPGCALIK